MILTYKDFRDFNNKWREHFKKPHQNKYVIAFWYPFAVIALIFFIGMFASIISSVKSQPSHRKSSKYKKVIKEGFLWDSIEYHEV